MTWLTITWAIYRLFNLTSEVVKEEVKIDLSNWLLNSSIEPKSNWATFFTYLFDQLFTKKHFSVKCFERSLVSSTFLFFVTYYVLIIAGINPVGENIVDYIAPIGLGLVWNGLPDYVSLLQTRYLMEFSNSRQNIIWIVVFVAIDFMLTLLIFIVLSYLIWALVTSIGSVHFMTPSEWKGILVETSYDKDSDFIAIVRTGLISTFFTSIWLWLFLIASFAAKFIAKMGKALALFKDLVDVENKPFKALGFMSIVLVTIIYLVWGIYLMAS